MTIHACLRRRNRCVRRDFNSVVTVPTINAQLSSMHLVTKGNWLRWLVANIRRAWTKSIGPDEDDIEWCGCPNKHPCRQKQVGPPRKNEVISRHEMHRPCAFVNFFTREDGLECPQWRPTCQGRSLPELVYLDIDIRIRSVAGHDARSASP